jgi:hypothetical protein
LLTGGFELVAQHRDVVAIPAEASPKAGQFLFRPERRQLGIVRCEERASCG